MKLARSKVRTSSIALIAIAAAFSAYFVSLNFHEIDPDQMYRSAQLNKAELEFVVEHFHIKTIVNLRGENKNAWFKNEVAVAAKYGVKLINIDMNSREIPDKDNLRMLIETYHSAARPLLVHDLSGADRCGEAAALYEMVAMHKSKEEALEMLSWRYHHFDFMRPAKRYFIEQYQGEQWALNDYNPCSGQYKYYDTHTYKCHPEMKKPCTPLADGDGLFSETPQCQ